MTSGALRREYGELNKIWKEHKATLSQALPLCVSAATSLSFLLLISYSSVSAPHLYTQTAPHYLMVLITREHSVPLQVWEQTPRMLVAHLKVSSAFYKLLSSPNLLLYSTQPHWKVSGHLHFMHILLCCSFILFTLYTHEDKVKERDLAALDHDHVRPCVLWRRFSWRTSLTAFIQPLLH